MHARTMTSIAMLALFFVSSLAHAQWRDQNGTAVPSNSWQQHEDGFAAMLQLAQRDDYERFQHEWTTTAVEHAPQLTTVSNAHRGDQVVSSVVYSGCAANPSTGACDARMSWRVLKPDGDVYAEYADLSLANGQPIAKNVLQLSPVTPIIRFEPEDPSGTYLVQMSVFDPVRNVRLQLERGVVLEEGATRGADQP